MSKYRTSWSEILKQVNEAQSHTVRYTDPLNKKRFAVPFKTHADAEKKMAQLKKDGVKDIEITMDTLKPGVNFEEAYEKDHEVSMARTDLQSIADKALVIDQHLKEHHTEETGIEGWIASKITKASDYINAVHDHMIYSPEMNEQSKEPYGWTLVSKAKDLAKKFAGNMTKAYDEIEKLAKDLSKNDEVQKALRQYNEELKEEISPVQIKKLKDTWADLKTIPFDKVKPLRNFLDKYSTDSLMQLAQANINFVSNMARSVMNKRKFNDPKHAGSMKEGAAEDMERISKLRTRQMMLQTQLNKMDKADPKNKTKAAIVKSDIENIQLRMDDIKQRQKYKVEQLLNKIKTEDTEPARPGPSNPNPNSINEKIQGLENKSEKSGIPYGILKQVYDRGMAAWKGGHRPGTTPQQWAFARVNSFITKGKTYSTADADLAKQARKN